MNFADMFMISILPSSSRRLFSGSRSSEHLQIIELFESGIRTANTFEITLKLLKNVCMRAYQQLNARSSSARFCSRSVVPKKSSRSRPTDAEREMRLHLRVRERKFAIALSVWIRRLDIAWGTS